MMRQKLGGSAGKRGRYLFLAGTATGLMGLGSLAWAQPLTTDGSDVADSTETTATAAPLSDGTADAHAPAALPQDAGAQRTTPQIGRAHV